MKEIKLSQGLVALVDDEDFEWLNQWKWCAKQSYNTFYAERRLSAVNGKRELIKLHHVIIGKPPKGFETDHENGNGLDNQRQNLRFVTNRQNQQNRTHQNSSSQYPGVGWTERDQRWRARIVINGKEKGLGYFRSEVKAFAAYCNAVHALGEKMIGEL